MKQNPDHIVQFYKTLNYTLLLGFYYLGFRWHGQIELNLNRLHFCFLLLLENHLPRHYFQQKVSSIPYSRRHLQQLERHVQFVEQEYRDSKRCRGHCEHCLKQNEHEQPVLISQQSTQPPPHVVCFLGFFRQFPISISSRFQRYE